MSRSIYAVQGEPSPRNRHLHQFLTSGKHERGFAALRLSTANVLGTPFLGWLVAEDVPRSTVSPVVITKYFTGMCPPV
jgi:hypothetical protein